MKPLPQPKHRHTYSFYKGNASEVTDKIPAYHSSGLKQYTRKIPPLQNKLLVNVTTLCTVLNEMLPQAICEAYPEGILINGDIVVIGEGIATAQRTRFRFKDLADFLGNLCQLSILPRNFDVPHARDLYYRR